MSIARRLTSPAETPPDELVGADRRALRRVVEEHVVEVRDKLEQIAALIHTGEVGDSHPCDPALSFARFERLRSSMDRFLPELGRFLRDDGSPR